MCSSDLDVCHDPQIGVQWRQRKNCPCSGELRDADVLKRALAPCAGEVGQNQRVVGSIWLLQVCGSLGESLVDHTFAHVLNHQKIHTNSI